MIGRTLGSYKVVEQLGAGGMGEVYRARDTKLDRDVAIKVLPEDFATDADRLARFEREAKLLAQLNHANIAAIYGMEDEGEQRFIVMEVVEGETLAERIARSGCIEVDEALEIARQIAEALEAAHENGVIHRDLKPANVKVTPEGKVKVLDFGLAKAYEPDGSASDVSPDLSHSPTMAAATRTGVILGTAAYMSPEQARGKPVDKRTDIWAFGCLLYEMLSGRRAFDGETVSDTMAAILRAEPDWEALPARLPSSARRVLERCLEKNSQQRLRDIGDARLAMAGAFETEAGSSPELTELTATGFWQRAVLLGATVLVVASIASFATWRLTRNDATGVSADGRPEEGSLRSLSINLSEAPLVFVGEATGGIGQTALAIDPEGRHVVYVGPSEAAGPGEATTRLYLRPIDRYEATPLRGTEGAYAPFFSPDGQWIGFFTGQQLMRVSIDGEQLLPITEANWTFGGSWNENDRIAVVTNDSQRVGIVTPGVDQLEFVQPDPHPEFYGVAQPHWLPGDDWLLLTCYTPLHLCALSTRTGAWRHLSLDGAAVPEMAGANLLAGSNPRYVETGHLVYSAPQENVAMAVRFDPATLETDGQPEVVLQGIRRENTHGALQLAIASNGDVAYAPGGNAVIGTFVWADGDGSVSPLGFEARAYGAFHLSDDGRRIAAMAFPRVGPQELWFLDTETGDERRWRDDGLVGGRGASAGPWISGTPQIIASAPGVPRTLFMIDSERAIGGEVLWSGTGRFRVERTGSDGSVLVQTGTDAAASYLSLISISELSSLSESPAEELTPLVEGQGIQALAGLSPDVDWLTYTTDERGPYEVWAIRLPPRGTPIPISDGAGELPRWSPRGDGLYYRNGERWYWVPYDESAAEPFGSPTFVLEGDYLQVSGPEYEVSPDGSRLLLLKGSGERTQSTLNLLTNWYAELEQRLPGGDSR